MCAPPQPCPGGGTVLERQGSCRPAVPFCPQGELVTASKAIIEKEYQPHVIVSTTGPNPFSTLTDRELDDYRRAVERKHRGPEGEQPRGSWVQEEAGGRAPRAPLSWADCRWPWKISVACHSVRILLCSRVCDLRPCTRSPPTFISAEVTAWSFLTDFSFSP